MALIPGTKLGPYEIQSPLGAGGMGEAGSERDLCSHMTDRLQGTGGPGESDS